MPQSKKQNVMPKGTILKKWRSFGENLRTAFNAAHRKVLLNQVQKSYSIIRSADTCPFNVFEQCLLNENYKALGEAPDSELEAAFLSIYFEYLQLINEGGTTDRIRHLGQIHVLSSKVQMTKMVVTSIIETQMDLLLPVLHDLGYKFVYRLQDLHRVVAMLKRDEMQLRVLIGNLPKDKGTKPTRQTFDNILFKLSEHLHTVIHKDKITVSEYCSMVNGYHNHIEALKRQQQKVKNHGR